MKKSVIRLADILVFAVCAIVLLVATFSANAAVTTISPSSENPTDFDSLRSSGSGTNTLYVSPGGNCGGVTPCYATLQAAVDAASDLDLIKVAAGTYTDVHARPRSDITTTGSVSQVVYLSKTLQLQGGYTTTNWATPYPKPTSPGWTRWARGA